MSNIPLITRDQVKFNWEFPNSECPYLHRVTGNIALWHQMKVSDRELSIDNFDLKEQVKAQIRDRLIRKIYPRELRSELLDIATRINYLDVNGYRGQLERDNLMKRLLALAEQLT